MNGLNPFEPCTTVVNIKSGAAYDIYVGRPSKWGNPFSHLDGTLAKYKVSSRREAIEKYAEYIQTRPDLLLALRELKGKILGCWCSPQECHGHILANLADAIEE